MATVSKINTPLGEVDKMFGIENYDDEKKKMEIVGTDEETGKSEGSEIAASVLSASGK